MNKNCDANLLLRVLLHDNEQYARAHEQIVSEHSIIRSAVLCEVMNVAYRSFKAIYGITESLPLEYKDRIRSRLVQGLLAMYYDGANFQDSGVLVCALLIYKYRRLDWVDSWLLARWAVLGEGVLTFDKELLRNLDVMAENGNRIPVISSYTQPLDDLPPRVFIQEKDVRPFIEAGLLHIQPPSADQRAKHLTPTQGVRGMNLFGKK